VFENLNDLLLGTVVDKLSIDQFF